VSSPARRSEALQRGGVIPKTYWQALLARPDESLP